MEVARAAATGGAVELLAIVGGAVGAVGEQQVLDAALAHATDAVAAARAIGAPVVVPVHTEGWAHFSESTDDLVRAFAAAGLGTLLRVPERGIPFEI